MKRAAGMLPSGVKGRGLLERPDPAAAQVHRERPGVQSTLEVAWSSGGARGTTHGT